MLPLKMIYLSFDCNYSIKICVRLYNYIQSVTGGTDQISGECSLGQTIPI